MEGGTRKLIEHEGDEYVTPSEAASMLGVSRQTIDRWGREGRITRYRRGIMRGVYYRRTEIESLSEMKPDEHEEQE